MKVLEALSVAAKEVVSQFLGLFCGVWCPAAGYSVGTWGISEYQWSLFGVFLLVAFHGTRCVCLTSSLCRVIFVASSR